MHSLQNFCIKCRHRPEFNFPVYSSFRYEAGVCTWIQDIKRNSRAEGWRELRLKDLPLEVRQGAFAGICCIPSDPRQRRRRGFQPTEVLAARLSSLLGRELVKSVFSRKAFLKPFRDMSIEERRQMAPRLFNLQRNLRGHILLVDDVLTTGASLKTCGDFLLASGCQVTAYVVARTPKASLTAAVKAS